MLRPQPKWRSRPSAPNTPFDAMPSETPKRKQFLFVDDDAQFLAVISELCKQQSNGQWVIRTATNHSQALEHLKTQRVDTVVLDLVMPVMNGIEFLRLLGRTHPGQQVVILTGRPDDGARKACQELGAALFLEKPTSPEQYQALFAALDAMGEGEAQPGFRGIMHRVGIQDVLQMECLARKSSVLVITTSGRQGRVYICDGEIVHAESGQLQGEMALYGLLALAGGEFSLQSFSEPAQRTISGHHEFLLMEAARLRDEAAADFGAGTGGALRQEDSGTPPGETPAPTEPRGVRIEEVLLCSGAGEVLYDWKCESIQSRLELFKSVEQQSMQAAKDVKSGLFHRLVMETGNGRLVIQIQPTFKLLVRSVLPATPTSRESQPARTVFGATSDSGPG
jgi:CheY-like chemotaxis protein